MKINHKIIIHSMQKSLNERGLGEKGRVQKYIDSEVIRLSDPYTPFDTGYLKGGAPKIGTKIGNGQVIYNAPYAKRQYYTNKGKGMRGGRWFERMKIDHKNDILRGAKEMAGVK